MDRQEHMTGPVHRTLGGALSAALLITVGLLAGAVAAESLDLTAEEKQPTVLITGANRGIGFEFVQQYADKGYRVIATCRNPDGADELKDMADSHDHVVVERLDLMDLEGIDALAERYQGQAIDVLINNAALMRGPDKEQTFGTLDYEEFDRFFHTNVRGPLRVTEAFWPHLKASENGTAATLTTGRGRESIPVPGFSYYKGSKAAIDNFQLDIGRQGRRDGIKVLVLMPGRVATHGENATKFFVPVEDSVAGMINVIETHSIKENGKTFRWNAGQAEDGA